MISLRLLSENMKLRRCFRVCNILFYFRLIFWLWAQWCCWFCCG